MKSHSVISLGAITRQADNIMLSVMQSVPAHPNNTSVQTIEIFCSAESLQQEKHECLTVLRLHEKVIEIDKSNRKKTATEKTQKFLGSFVMPH